MMTLALMFYRLIFQGPWGDGAPGPLRDPTETWPGGGHEDVEEGLVDWAHDLLGFSIKFPGSFWLEDSKIFPAGNGSRGQGVDRFKPSLGTRNERLGGQAERDQHRDHFKPLWDKSDSKIQRSPLQDCFAGVVPHLFGSKLGQLAARRVHWSRRAEERERGTLTCYNHSFMNQNYFLLLHLIFSTFQLRDWMKFCCFSPVIF